MFRNSSPKIPPMTVVPVLAHSATEEVPPPLVQREGKGKESNLLHRQRKEVVNVVRNVVY